MTDLRYAQKALHQYLLAEHVMTEESIRATWDTLTTDLSLEDALASSNAQLGVLGLEIAAVQFPPRHCKYYSLINKFPDEISKDNMGKVWTPAQHELIRLWLAAIGNNDQCSRATLLNTRSQLENSKLSLEEAEVLLERLLEEGWLFYMADDDSKPTLQSQVVLGPRTYLELSYLLVSEEFGMDQQSMPQIFKFMAK